MAGIVHNGEASLHYGSVCMSWRVHCNQCINSPIANTTATKQSIAYYYGDIYFKQGDPIRVRETVL